jgi:hypothetical protein
MNETVQCQYGYMRVSIALLCGTVPFLPPVVLTTCPMSALLCSLVRSGAFGCRNEPTDTRSSPALAVQANQKRPVVVLEPIA